MITTEETNEIGTDEARYFLPDEFEGLTTDDVSRNIVDHSPINYAKHFEECQKQDCNFSLPAYLWFLQQCDDHRLLDDSRNLPLPLRTNGTLRAVANGVMGYREIKLCPVPELKKFFVVERVTCPEALRVVAQVGHAGLRKRALEKLAAMGELK